MEKASQAFTNAFAPQALYLYGTYKPDGTPNFGLFCWATYCADDGHRFVACIGEDKLTRDRIRETGVFSASVVSRKMLPGADWCGCHSGYEADKSRVIPSHRGAVLDVPVPDDSPWAYELRGQDPAPGRRGKERDLHLRIRQYPRRRPPAGQRAHPRAKAGYR